MHALKKVGDAIRAARDLGAVHETELQNRGDAGWLVRACSIDAPCDRAYLEQGEERRYTLHVEGLSEGSARRVARLLEG